MFFITLVTANSAEPTPQFRTTEAEKIVEDYSETIQQTKLMLSHINFASVAIELGKYEQAEEHVNSALAIANVLNPDDFITLADTRLRYGKITYDVDGKNQTFNIPQERNVFSLERVKNFLSKSETKQAETVEVEAVHTKIALNLPEARAALNTSLTLLSERNYQDAAFALRDVYKDALFEEEEIMYPLWAVHDNLKLVESFIDQHDYNKARLALKKAVSSLEKYQKEADIQANLNEVNQLKLELSLFQQELGAVSPTLGQRASAKVSEWGNKVKLWFVPSDN